MQYDVQKNSPISSIQQALQLASDGDRILLLDPHYDEAVVINKSIHLIGHTMTTFSKAIRIEKNTNTIIENITFQQTERIDCFGDVVFRHVHIVNPKTDIALFVSGSKIQWTQFQLLTATPCAQGIQVKNGEAHLENGEIHGPFGVGCFINHSKGTLHQVIFEDNVKGLQFEKDAHGHVTACSFSNHTGIQCVVMSSSTLTMKHSQFRKGQTHALSIIEESHIQVLHCDFIEHEDFQIYVRQSEGSFEACHLERANSGFLFEQGSKARLLYITCQQHQNLQIKSVGPNDLHIEECVLTTTNGNALNVKEKGRVRVERTLIMNGTHQQFPQAYIDDSTVDFFETHFQNAQCSAIYAQHHAAISLTQCHLTKHSYLQVHVRQSKITVRSTTFRECTDTALFIEQEGEGIIEHCRFERSYSSQLAFNVQARGTVSHTQFEQAGTNAIFSENSTVTLEYISVKEHTASYPAFYFKNSILSMHAIQLSHCMHHAIDILDNCNVTASTLSLKGSTQTQLLIRHSTFTGDAVTIENGLQGGLSTEFSTVHLKNSHIRQNGAYGISAETTALSMTQSFIDGHQTGIRQKGGSLRAEALFFTTNDTQYTASDSDVQLKYSHALKGGTGIYLYQCTASFSHVLFAEHSMDQLILKATTAALQHTTLLQGYGNGFTATDCPYLQWKDVTIGAHDGEDKTIRNSHIDESPY